jgi:hypothetical protein
MWIALGIAVTLLIAGLVLLWFVGSVGYKARKQRAIERAEASRPDSQAI